MKITDPRGFAFLNSLIISAFTLLLLLIASSILNIDLKQQQTLWIFLIFGLISFIFVLLLLNFGIERFIYDKIRVIYKTIRSYKAPKKDDRKQRLRLKGLMEDVEKEVREWDQDKRKEIDYLRALEAYRREYIGNVSHELKTPIFNIQGYISTLLEGGLDDPNINKEYLKRTEKSVNRLITIIEDLEGISRLETGELKLNVTTFDVIHLVHETVEFLEMKARKRHVNVRVVEPPEKSLMVQADIDKIRQVLVNLIDNAIRYCRKEEPRVKISFFHMEENILIEITDNGIGIDQKDIPRLFDRFFRTELGRAAEKKGKGLGLSIVKHIIEAHDQTIHVRSTIGIGSTFGFTLLKAK